MATLTTVPGVKSAEQVEIPAEVQKAFDDIRTNKDSGVMEVHFSQGGVAKVYVKLSKTYK
jgi:hypothetical protein